MKPVMSEPELAFDIIEWLGAESGSALERETLASLRIRAGADGVALTEVDDRIAHTVREHINVPAYSVARWLAINWWRLRWEPLRSSTAWQRCHSMPAIGGGFAWPSLTFASDGEFVQVQVKSETASDASAIRYLRDFSVDIPTLQFERAVTRFIDEVAARIAARLPGERELLDLQEELEAEKRDASVAELCKLQAVAGIDPGEAPEHWLKDLRALMNAHGALATEEALAAVESKIEKATAALDAIRNAPTTVKLDWVKSEAGQQRPLELPWERGERLARALRSHLASPRGPLKSEILAQALDAHLPLKVAPFQEHSLRGGYRNGHNGGRTAVLITKPRETSQRFELARLIGAAMVSTAQQAFLPVSNAGTALQKVERSFAREFLCPWSDLDAFTDEHGMDEEGIEAAAEHFNVSEHLVLATLVNKRKLSREHLPD